MTNKRFPGTAGPLAAGDIKKRLSILKGADILLIIPPFRYIFDMALGAQNLQALAVERGYKAEILYLDMLFAAYIGVECYEDIYDEPIFRMMGERLFARAAYGMPPLGNNPGYCTDEGMSVRGSKEHTPVFLDRDREFDMNFHLEIESRCMDFIGETSAVIAALGYKIIGCSALTGQTNCSIALLREIKKRAPGTVTIMGGSNCSGQMAEGIASLSHAVDYIFSGESEISFPGFLDSFSSGDPPRQRIIRGEALKDLDMVPPPDYDIFLKQFDFFLGGGYRKRMRIWYETSRGCCWGEKGKCRFCGVAPIAYRQKSANKVIAELEHIAGAYAVEMLIMVDNIIPPSYFEEVLPVIAQKKDWPSLGYLIRPSVDLHGLLQLKEAGIGALFAGIETFSPHLLKLMRKGVTGRQNLLLLRNSESIGIACDWSLLWGFPGDRVSDYEEILRILPLIRHLPPPKEIMPMTIVRYSPYLDESKDYGIANLRPWAVYGSIHPGGADTGKLANYYIGDYACESYENPGVMQKIADEVTLWRKTWKDQVLMMKNFMDAFIIYDKRDINEKKKTHVLEHGKAKETMTVSRYTGTDTQKWAVEQKLGLILDSWYVPLVTADPGLLLEFEK